MPVKFSADVVPIIDLKTNAGRIVQHVADIKRPVLLTSGGLGVAVVQSLDSYEAAQEEREFMVAVVAGLSDIAAGRHVDMAEARRRFCLSET